MAAKKKDTLSYTEASTELEAILAEIESGEADVDELSAKVERAATLIQLCRTKLAKTEMQVKKAVADLTEDTDAEASSPSASGSPLSDSDDPPFETEGN